MLNPIVKSLVGGWAIPLEVLPVPSTSKKTRGASSEVKKFLHPSRRKRTFRPAVKREIGSIQKGEISLSSKKTIVVILKLRLSDGLEKVVLKKYSQPDVTVICLNKSTLKCWMNSSIPDLPHRCSESFHPEFTQGADHNLKDKETQNSLGSTWMSRWKLVNG